MSSDAGIAVVSAIGGAIIGVAGTYAASVILGRRSDRQRQRDDLLATLQHAGRVLEQEPINQGTLEHIEHLASRLTRHEWTLAKRLAAMDAANQQGVYTELRQAVERLTLTRRRRRAADAESAA
jgi:hypothetical protein